jgi:cell division septation protein DedD
VARAEPGSTPLATAPAAAASAGGYAVQVTSQRSEAEAEAAFKALQAKFPTQLGSHQPIIHRADLGDKGTFYRALVGPFASAEAAAGMCSNLKAAGGSCIVQKN